MDLYNQIREIAADAARAYEKKLYYGTVLSASPLSVKIDQKLVLSSEFLSLAESVTELRHGETVIRPGLSAGNKVILISMGKSDYLILDRVV